MKNENLKELVLNATAMNGRILKVVLLEESGLTPTDFVDRLNAGLLQIVGDEIIDPQAEETVGEITHREEDAGGTDEQNFALENEAFIPLDEVTDSQLLGHIADLRGLIDGRKDQLGEALTIHLGFLLAERAKRNRQRDITDG